MLDELGIPSAAVIGHSLGGLVAQRMAVLRPERVSKLVLAATAASARNEVVRSLVPSVQALTDSVDRTFVREFQLSTIYRAIPDAFLDRVISESLKLPARVWKAVLAGMLDLPTLADTAQIRCPTRIFWGDRDAIFSRSEQEELLRQIPGARLHILTEVGHALHWEAPDEFARLLLATVLEQ
jgi:pimeloyl-ACP methyl ester carboxylesterase